MRLVLFFFLCFVVIQPISAALKKCKGDDGVTHYYANIMPPECQEKTTIEMNYRGVVLRKNEVTQAEKLGSLLSMTLSDFEWANYEQP